MDKNKQPAPEFKGHCAFAVSIGKKGIIGDPKCTLEKDGKLYVFNNSVAKLLFRILPNRLIQAKENWKSF